MPASHLRKGDAVLCTNREQILTLMNGVGIDGMASTLPSSAQLIEELKCIGEDLGPKHLD